MGSFTSSVSVFEASWRILRSRKELVVFPVLAVFVVAGLATWAVSFILDLEGATVGTYVAVIVGFYLITMYIAMFFRAAVISQAAVTLSGGDPTVIGGLRAAGAVWLRVLLWALLSATLSVVVRIVERRTVILGRFYSGMTGLIWDLATYLVMPVMVLEGAKTKDSIHRSAVLFRRTWGENVLRKGGVGAFGMALFTVPFIGLVWLAIQLGSEAAGRVCMAIALGWAVLVGIFMTAITGISQVALYRHAADGARSEGFSSADLHHVFPRWHR